MAVLTKWIDDKYPVWMYPVRYKDMHKDWDMDDYAF
jgi:hypothetical protein